MTAYTDDDVTAATKVITYHVNSPTYDDDVEIARAVLAAVAPAIAARTLREAADWFHCDRCLERALAEQVDE